MKNQIVSLDEAELEEINGGIAPVVIYAGFVVVGFGLAALADYLDGGLAD